MISGTSAWMVQAQSGDGLEEKGIGLATRFDEQERIRVIVQLNVPDHNKAAELMTLAIHKAQGDVISSVKSGNVHVIHEYDYIPFMAVEVDRAGFEALQNNPLVVGIEEDILMQPLLTQSIPLINADDVWAAGYTGNGQVVAVLDTGVDKNHPALAGKVVSEACYSSTTSTTTSICPGGVNESIEPGSALPYAGNCPIGECDHGTHVAGIVAANSTSLKGVAKDAKLIAIQVFSRVSSNSIGSWSSDQIKGLERVFALKDSHNIASVNLSLGSQYPKLYTDVCDDINQAYLNVVNKLKNVGIVTIAASGNEYYSDRISSPACISSVVSVGATTDADTVAPYSNSASILDLLAPGSSIYSTIPGGGYANYNGTSMATPHVAGAWALLRSYDPSATVDEVLQALNTTGVPILDSRDPENPILKPRTGVYAAAPLLRPFKPTNIDATDGTQLDKVTLTWIDSDYATYYQVFRNPKNSAETATQLTPDSSINTFDDTTAEPGTIFNYWVIACSVSGCSDFSVPDTGWRSYTVIPPPSGVSASDGEFNNKVQVSWYGVGGATKYKIFRNPTNSLVNAELLAEPTTLFYNDFSALNDTSYYYWVQACNLEVCSDHSVSDVGITNNIHNIYLPLLLKNGVASTDPIKNGNFELGRDGSWTESSSNGWDLIINSDFPPGISPRSGSWLTWLGGDDFETSKLSQSVLVSSSRPYLHYWYWIDSGDFCDYDMFKLKVNSSVISQSDLCSLTNTGGWVERVVNLSGYAGSTVTLMFEVATDESINSNFFLDDVSMSSISTTSTAVVDGLQDLGDVTRSRTK
jgi:subtilisin family serine protease